MLTCGNGHALRPSVVFDAHLEAEGSTVVVSLESASGVTVDLDCVEGCTDAAFSEDLTRRVRAAIWGSLEAFGAVAARVRTCRACGCTDAMACSGGCAWVQPDLCSSCVAAPTAVAS
jgi:hypothetical protein